MSWDIIKPNPENDMFRLYELYDEKIDKINYTEEELDFIQNIQKLIIDESGEE